MSIFLIAGDSLSTWPTIWTAVAAIGSVLSSGIALAIALSTDRLQRWRRRGKFETTTGHEPPYLQQTLLTDQRSYMVRLRVKNSTALLVESVRVVIGSLEKETSTSGTYTQVGGFIPIALKWTHDNKPTIPFLSPEEFRFVDIGMLRPDYREMSLRDQSHPIAFHLSTEVGAGFEILEIGSYQMRLLTYTKDGPKSDLWYKFHFAGRTREPLIKAVARLPQQAASFFRRV